MAFSQAYVDGLRAAIATGSAKFRYADGREVQYRTQAELERALAMAERGVVAAGGEKPSRSFVVGF